MKYLIIPFLTGFISYGCSYGQAKQETVKSPQQNILMDSFQFNFKSAHPCAQALMTDEFYFSPIEETGPFGNDDGWEAAYRFREWRLLNKTASPVIYLKELIESWQYPYFDYNEMDTAKIKAYVNQKREFTEEEIQQQLNAFKEMNKNDTGSFAMKLSDRELREMFISSTQGLNGIYLLGQDNAIIGTGFAQFVLEGRIDKDIRGLTITAIKRQLLPMLINRYDEDYRGKRKQQLKKMLEVIQKAAS